MKWILQSPQILSTFGNLGYAYADGYHVNENCNEALSNILHNLLTEDKYLRTYRRCISFGQNIEKDIIPLLIHTKEDKTIELLMSILVNLSIPIECLLSVNVICKTDFGRHAIFEINNLLASAKAAFRDHSVTKVVVEFLKKNSDFNKPVNLTPEQCTNISNGLLLLRNILHIPEVSAPAVHTMQNQILWNIFSQSIDKVLIRLMIVPEASKWSVAMVQLVAMLFKDQHEMTLHKLQNAWLKEAQSDSSEDNESNTSQPDRGSVSSLMLSTSDSSNNGGSGKSSSNSGEENLGWASAANAQLADLAHLLPSSSPPSLSPSPPQPSPSLPPPPPPPSRPANNYRATKRKLYDGSVATSSSEDKPQKPVHQDPHLEQKPNSKIRIGANVQYRKRKKIVKKAKAPILNLQGLSGKTPSDDDITNMLKEFTVEFLLKGYNSLVRTIHDQILTNVNLEIDTAHFFWLLTYFLKFAIQIDLDLEHLNSVLSFDIIAYLTAEGVNLCEEFELALKVDGSDLKPSIRRLHLVVTAIREFVKAIEVYKKKAQCSGDKHEMLAQLQTKVCEADELRELLVLLLRHYDPALHHKPYLQDLIVTNHILLVLVNSLMNLPNYKGKIDMADHIKQFATGEMMHQYSLLLEDYSQNGEFVNDCILTVMHHVGGELESSIALIQPKILKIFSSIWNSELELCDDWSDLINYVIYASTRRPNTSECAAFVLLGFVEDPDGPFVNPPPPSSAAAVHLCDADDKDSDYGNDRWTEAEISSLGWNFMQCNMSQDMIRDIVKLFKDDGIIKSREFVIKELYKQNLIEKSDYESLLKTEFDTYSKASRQTKDTRNHEIGKLCEELIQDGKLRFLEWVQKVLLDTCFAKIYIERKAAENTYSELKFECFKQKHVELPQISPVCYHSLLMNKSVPLVTWNLEQASICKNVKFLQLVNDLGLHLPIDSGKIFIRIPHFWTAEFLYEVAGMIKPIDTKKLRFSKNDVPRGGIFGQSLKNTFTLADDVMCKDVTYTSSSENYYRFHKQNHNATVVNFSPMPGVIFEDGVNGSTEANKGSWLDIVQRSQELPNVFETVSMASDLTRMYVSDEDEKSELLPAATGAVSAVGSVGAVVIGNVTAQDSGCCSASKRPRVIF